MRFLPFGRASALLAGVLAGASSVQAEVCTPRTFAGAFAGEETLCQNWDADEQQTFWFLSQGSQIIPYAWFLALEQADKDELFREPAHLDGLRYLPQRPTGKNPDGLPVGFTKDSAKGNDAFAAIARDWLGLTCAACHTGQVEYRGRKMLIDGAPAMADFEGFVSGLVAAMRATQNDDAKFDRFAGRVLGAGDATAAAKAALRQRLREVTAFREAWMRRNQGAHPYGFARLDAIGAIFNEITANAMGLPGNAKPADAPVSYPFIWDTPQHDKVQWNGSVENNGTGSLGRNVGEVLGVFGSLRLDTRLIPRGGHESSVDVAHLGRLEELLWKLQSPQWPGGTILPGVDDANGALVKGRQAFERLCVRCHADIRRDDPRRRIVAELTPLDELETDPGMAANFAHRRYDSGPLRGRARTYIFVPGQRFEPFGAEGMGVEFLGNAVIGTITHNLIRHPRETVRALNAGRKKGDVLFQMKDDIAGKLIEVARSMRIAGMPNEPAPELVYKARPLNGIWATAPYLHNGSVRTMRQLLLPAARRQRTFRVGSREYDPNDVGFVDEGGFTLDTSLPGNSNAGHEYGADELSRDAGTLEALLAYLKTL